MNTRVELQAEVTAELSMSRLDQVASDMFPDFSRSRLQVWIKSGELTVNGEPRKPRDKVHAGDLLEIRAELAEIEDLPQPIELDIVFEDDDIIVLNKQAGLVVHPGAGNQKDTLVNGLLYHAGGQAELPRAGIVHRLDKETSGLMVIARTLKSHSNLVEQLQERSVSRIYEALVFGRPSLQGEIDAPIGRHPTNRVKMAVVDSGKPALTRWQTLARFAGVTHLQLSLVTGRTHQIRVHMQSRGFPLVGDPTYKANVPRHREWSEELRDQLFGFKRQALHARKLSFVHPANGKLVKFESPLPADISELLEALDEVA